MCSSDLLPTLAEGLGQLDKIKGENLVNVGKGIAAIGAGMVAFTAGSLASMGGSILTSLGEGLTHLFGGQTPIDKFVEFANLPIDSKKAKNNAEAFAAFTKALGSYGGEARDTAFESIAKGMLKFFGVDLPYDKFVEFSQLNIDGKKTKQNAEALVAFNKALASYKGEGRDTAFESMAKGMLKFFGVKLPVDKFVEFSKIEMNGKKVKQDRKSTRLNSSH